MRRMLAQYASLLRPANFASTSKAWMAGTSPAMTKSHITAFASLRLSSSAARRM
jgi:hypothetical protein